MKCAIDIIAYRLYLRLLRKALCDKRFFLGGILIQCHILLSANEKRLNHLFHSRIILALEIMVFPLFEGLFDLLLNESNCVLLQFDEGQRLERRFRLKSVLICAAVVKSESQC